LQHRKKLGIAVLTIQGSFSREQTDKFTVKTA